MKKILAAVLSVVLCLFMALPAFADGTPEASYTGDNESADVKVTINGNIVHVYLVDIVFDDLAFTYSSGSVWDPTDYTYKPSKTATWQGNGTVKIVNHSDLPVKYTVAKGDVKADYGPLDLVIDNASGTIAKCEVGDQIGSHFAEAECSVSGVPTKSEITNQTLGTILVKIEKVTAEP